MSITVTRHLHLLSAGTVHCSTPSLNQAAFFALSPAEQAAVAAAEPSDLVRTRFSLSLPLIESYYHHVANANSPSAQLRLAAYVCMLPAAHASPEILAGKVALFQAQCRTSHWPTAPCPYSLDEMDATKVVDLNDFPPDVQSLVGARQRSGAGSSAGCSVC